MNGYCKYTIKGKEVGIKYGLVSMGMIDRRLQDFPMLLNNQFDYAEGYSYVIYSGYVNNCRRKEELPEFTYEDFYDKLEEEGLNGKYSQETVNAIVVWHKSQETKRNKKDDEGKGDESKDSENENSKKK